MNAITKQLAAWLGQILAGRLDGSKTYLAAAGLVGLALYQFSLGQYESAIQSLFLAAVAGGLRHALTKLGLEWEIVKDDDEADDGAHDGAHDAPQT